MNNKSPSENNHLVDIIPKYYVLDTYYNTIQRITVKHTRNEEKTVYIPVINSFIRIKSIYRNVETNVTNYEVEWEDKNGRKRTLIQPASIWGRTNKITELADLGIPVNTFNSAEVVRYLEEYRHYYEQELEAHSFIERLGFYGDSFVLPNKIIGNKQSLKFIPNSTGDKQYAKGFRSKGTFGEWKEHILEPLKTYPHAIIFLLASVGSIILKDFKVKPFIVEISGNTTQGKTVAMLIACTVWGEPESIIQKWNATKVSIERNADLLTHLPLFLDDTKNGNVKQIHDIVYQFSLGVGKSRGNIVGTQVVGTWRNILLSTGEKKITEFGQNAGVSGRVLSLHSPPFGRGDTTELIDELEFNMGEYYGTAGEVFVEWYLKLSDEEMKQWTSIYRDLTKSYQEQAKGNTVIKRIAKYMAILHTTALMANEAWNTDIPNHHLYDVWGDMLETNEELDKPKQAMNDFIDVCTEHSRNFMTNKDDFEPSGSYWGDWNYKARTPQDIVIIPAVARKILDDKGYDSSTILTEWRERGWIDCSANRFVKTRRLFNGSKKDMTIIKLEKVYEDMEFVKTA